MLECTILKKNLKKIFPEGPRTNVWEPRENVSPGPAVALDGPALNTVAYTVGELN